MHLEAIWLKRAKRGPMDPKRRARAVAGRGLVGNAEQGGKRQVTLLSADAWDEVRRDLGEEVDPRLRRANLFVRGVDFCDTGGRRLRVGGCLILVHGENHACGRMDQGFSGLRRALTDDWRAGVYGEVIEDGKLAVGDEVAWEDGAG